MELSLVVLAAGMGSRYGGLKQLDALGPNGETIMDYSVYDAIQAGFTKIVFVIREELRADFEEKITSKFSDKIAVEFVYQNLEVEIDGIKQLPKRTKPWGTAHALLAAKLVVKEPFAVLNADDFYGRTSLVLIADFLRQKLQEKHYAMISFVLKNTLSDHGSVSRGICTINKNQLLETVVERTKIKKQAGQFVYEEDGLQFPLDENEQVSMNLWGFHPSIFQALEEAFAQFLKDNFVSLKAELYIPTVVNDLVLKEAIRLTAIPSDAHWLGLTYSEDKPAVQFAFNQLIRASIYPPSLWK